MLGSRLLVKTSIIGVNRTRDGNHGSHLLGLLSASFDLSLLMQWILRTSVFLDRAMIEGWSMEDKDDKTCKTRLMTDHSFITQTYQSLSWTHPHCWEGGTSGVENEAFEYLTQVDVPLNCGEPMN